MKSVRKGELCLAGVYLLRILVFSCTMTANTVADLFTFFTAILKSEYGSHIYF
jgi:hypothetical protein